MAVSGTKAPAAIHHACPDSREERHLGVRMGWVAGLGRSSASDAGLSRSSPVWGAGESGDLPSSYGDIPPLHAVILPGTVPLSCMFVSWILTVRVLCHGYAARVVCGAFYRVKVGWWVQVYSPWSRLRAPDLSLRSSLAFKVRFGSRGLRWFSGGLYGACRN